MSTVITIIVTILIFGVLIVAHEYGHFLVSRLCGVVVEEFSVGMGPLLWKKVRNGTQYSIRAIPIGGFCRLKGEDEDEEDRSSSDETVVYISEDKITSDEGSILKASPLKRIFIFAAGALMNFMTAVLIFFVLMLFSGTDASTTIATFTDNSPALAAGMEVGDRIVSIDGTEIKQWEDISSVVKYGTGESLSITVEKQNGEIQTYNVTPYFDEETNSYLIGITPKAKTNVWHAFIRSFEMLWTYIKLIIQVFIGLFTGKYGLDAISGPIGAAVMIGQYIPQGLIYILSIAASISVSLGVFNLLPIPALDGSRILFALIELIKGSPVNKKAEGVVHFFGFVALMALAVFIAYKDIVTFF